MQSMPVLIGDFIQEEVILCIMAWTQPIDTLFLTIQSIECKCMHGCVNSLHFLVAKGMSNRGWVT